MRLKQCLLFVGNITVAGLSAANVSNDLVMVLQGQSTLPYWLQTGAIALYLTILVGVYVKDGKSHPDLKDHLSHLQEN